jgi:CubicO group peptidase (beta-lactamase class C family)
MPSRFCILAFASALLLCPVNVAATPTIASSYAEAIDHQRYGKIDSLLVWRKGHLELERYWRGYTADQFHQCFSVTKSITCLLTLQAMQEGKLPGPETPLVKLLPAYAEVLTRKKASITLGHVLGMSAGFRWDELSVGYNDPGNAVSALLRAPDPVRYLFQRDLATEPGTVFAYNSALSNLLGRIVEHAVGEPIDRFAERKLFKPLGISEWRWDRLGQELNCGWGLSLKPRDMLTIGRFLLQKGQWQGRQLIDARLLAEAFKPRLPVNPHADYGWQFWVKHYPDGKPYPLAIGWGGQFIVLLPELDTVIVSTAEDYDADREGIMAFLDEFVGKLAQGSK